MTNGQSETNPGPASQDPREGERASSTEPTSRNTPTLPRTTAKHSRRAKHVRFQPYSRRTTVQEGKHPTSQIGNELSQFEHVVTDHLELFNTIAMAQLPGHDFTAPPSGAQDPQELNHSALTRRYSQNEARLSQTKDQLQSIIAIRSASRASRRTNSPGIEEKDRQILALQRQLEATKLQLEAQQERILQQQATIRVQSDTIQTPRSGSLFSTPHHRDENRNFTSLSPMNPPPNFDVGATKPQASQPPRSIYGYHPSHNLNPPTTPSFNPPRSHLHEIRPQSPFPPGTGRVYPTRFTSTANTSSLQINEYGSPEQLRLPPSGGVFLEHGQNYSNTGAIYPSPTSQRNQSQSGFIGPIHPKSSQKPSSNRAQQSTSLALVKNPHPSSNSNISEKFQKVFEMSEKYALSHVNFPSNAGDNSMPMAIKEKLIKASSTNTAHFLMSNAQSRFFLATKIIDQWLIKHVLRTSTYKGFNIEIDTNIERAKGQIYESTPPAVRYLCQSTIANEIRKLQTLPGFPEFVKNLCRDRGNQLWAIVKPLMHKKTTKDWEDLLELMQEAHKLANMMFTGADEYRFDFPAIDQPFSTANMMNRDPFIRSHSESDLMARGALVRLGISPHITVRTNGAGGTISMGNIKKADVLIKWPVVVKR